MRALYFLIYSFFTFITLVYYAMYQSSSRNKYVIFNVAKTFLLLKSVKKIEKNFVQCQLPVQEYVKLGHCAICFSMKDKQIGYITIVDRSPFFAY